MDQTDLNIMNILQENCKTTTREIGKIVGLTAPAVSERIARLRETGGIKSFGAKLDPSAISKHMSAYVMVNVPPENYELFLNFTNNSPAIIEHHHIIGPNNALLKLIVTDVGTLEEELKKIRKFGLSETAIVLSTYFDHKPMTF